MELMIAHKQWKNRPPDERVGSLEELYRLTKAQRDAAKEREVPFADLRLEAQNDDLYVTRGGAHSRLTNWAFSQLAARVAAPASYLETLPATLAAQNLNHGLARRVQEAAGRLSARLLFHVNGSWTLRAVTTDVYERFWNEELAGRMLHDLQPRGWEPARPDIREELGNFPALYLGDRDMFAFLRLRNVTIDQPIDGQRNAPLYKGVIYQNSEVGASMIRAWRFFYNEMCGNHIIWGASDVVELEARHVGNVRDKVQLFAAAITKYANESVDEDEAAIKRATHKLIAATKDEVLDALFGKRSLGLSRKVIEAGYAANVQEQDGDPRTVWGMVQGLTRHSQTIPFADKRTEIDKAAGRLLSMTEEF